MPLIVFVPGILCALALLQWDARKALLNVALPTLLFCPTYYYWKTTNLPGLDVGMTAFLPIGLALLLFHLGRLRLSRTDGWMVLFIVSTSFADYRSGQVSFAKYRFFDAIVTALVPYMAGKLLIEPSGAIAASRRFVALLLVTCLFSIPEFFFRVNLFSRAWGRFFPGLWPGILPQERWHFTRVSGPYASPELAGLILLTGVLLTLWLWKWNANDSVLPWFQWLRFRGAIPFALVLLIVTLLMTESRGPWIGTVVALTLAYVGRARNVPRRALLITPLIVIVTIVAYSATKEYSSGKRIKYGSERETAQYRRQLLENYLPIAQAGGAWGWGQFFPIVGDQVSIDNEFLLVFLVQGYVGAITFILLIVEACYKFARLGLTAELASRRHFGFTMLGILAGWVVTLGTVFLGVQTYQLFFLIIGWSQAVVFVQRRAPVPLPVPAPLTRVYT